MPFFAIFALLTTALTVVNSGTDVERLWDADIVAERYRAPKIIIAVVTMITTAIVLPVRYYPLSALLGIFCRFDETTNMTRCSEEKKKKKNTGRGKMGRKKMCRRERSLKGKNWVVGMDGARQSGTTVAEFSVRLLVRWIFQQTNV